MHYGGINDARMDDDEGKKESLDRLDDMFGEFELPDDDLDAFEATLGITYVEPTADEREVMAALSGISP